MAQQPENVEPQKVADGSLSLVLFALFVCVMYLAVKGVHYTATREFGLNWFLPIALLVSLAGAGVRYTDCPRAAVILIRSIGVFCLVYLMAGYLNIPPDMENTQTFWFAGFDVALVVCIGLSLVGIIARPGLLYFVLSYVLFYKLKMSDTFGIGLTDLDYKAMLEFGKFTLLAIVAWWFLEKLCNHSPRLARNKTFAKIIDCRNSHVEFAVLTAVAFHFGNYYVSAIAKIGVGESLTYWAFQNPTEFLMLHSWDNGTQPLSFGAPLFEAIYHQFAFIRPITNSATLIGQFICAIAIIRISWSIWITVFYDLMHTAIAITTGIFFWKFIALNAAIVAGLRFITIRRLNIVAQGFLVMCVLSSNLVFETAVFAWLDTRSLNQYRFFAMTDAGKEYEVPSNYFLATSITFAQNRVAWPRQGAFGTATWGTVHSRQKSVLANACKLPLTDGQEAITQFAFTKQEITRFIQKHHKLILSMIDDSGYINYDLYPHHIFSVPWKFSDFKQLDKRQIVQYRYVSEAVCMSMTADGPHRDVKSNANFLIPVTSTDKAT